MTPDKRREAIIDATLRVMTRKGMAATTVRDVAEEMGTSSGLIHHYVSSMDELLAAAFEQAAGQDLAATRESMAAGDGPVERLARFFDGYARADQDWAFQLWLDAWSEAGRRPAVRATSYRLNVAWQSLIADTIRDGVRAEQMTCAAPDDVAWRVLSLLDGLTLQAVAHRTAIDRDAVIEWGAAYAESELGLPAGALTP
jgi:AcrR family transcriptional regulator